MVWTCLLAAALLAGEDPESSGGVADSGLAVRVRELVGQLDADGLAVRQAAEESLLDLGPAALDWLPTDTSRAPVEVRERLERIRASLEQVVVTQAMQPTRVTLVGELSLREALEAIEKQTGNRLIGFEDRAGVVKASFDNALFWESLDQVLDQARLDVNPYGGQSQALVLSARPDGISSRCGRAVYRGAFRFEPIRVEARRDLKNPAVNVLRLAVQVAWEPRLAPILVRQPLAAIEAWDELDRPLEVPHPRGVLAAGIESGISAVELSLPLQLPDRRATRVAHIRGVLGAVVPGPVGEFEFSDLANAADVSQRKAGVVVTLEQWRRNRDVFEARLRVRFDDPGPALESHRGWIHRNPAYLVAADGQRIDNIGTQTTHQSSNDIGLSYLFDGTTKPERCRLVYRTPVLVQMESVNYELADIPLP